MPAANTVDKRALLDALTAQLRDELAVITRRAREAADAATHEENRPENDKDMRSTEASYVARGQAARAEELERDLARLALVEPRRFEEGDAIAAPCLVTLEQGGRRSLHLLVPAGGGVTLSVAGATVRTVTPSSPLGAALVGLGAGDDVEVEGPSGARTWTILAVE